MRFTCIALPTACVARPPILLLSMTVHGCHHDTLGDEVGASPGRQTARISNWQQVGVEVGPGETGRPGTMQINLHCDE